MRFHRDKRSAHSLRVAVVRDVFRILPPLSAPYLLLCITFSAQAQC